MTFNYDRLIEYYFETVLSHAFSLTSDEAQAIRKSIPIVHLHGQIEGRKFGDFADLLLPGTVRDIASGVRIIHDSMPENDPKFEKAYELFRESGHVCCLLGLSYHPENIRRLQIGEFAKSATLFGTAFEIGRAEITVAKARIGKTLLEGPNNEKVEKFLRERVPLR